MSTTPPGPPEGRGPEEPDDVPWYWPIVGGAIVLLLVVLLVDVDLVVEFVTGLFIAATE